MAIFRADLQELSRSRLREARVLLRAKLYAGAYHTAGFAIECAIKACIAKNVNRYQWPDKEIVNQSWTHDFTKLVGIAGLTPSLSAAKRDAAFDANWSIVTKWKPEIRYKPSVPRREADALYRAIASRASGILQWLRNY